MNIKIDNKKTLKDFQDYYKKLGSTCSVQDNIVVLNGDSFEIAPKFSYVLKELKTKREKFQESVNKIPKDKLGKENVLSEDLPEKVGSLKDRPKKSIREINREMDEITNRKPSEKDLEELAEVLNPKYDKLYYGKDQTEEVVSIEIEGENAVLFKKDGSIEFRPMSYYYLSNKKDDKSKALQGSGYFKYMNLYKSEYDLKEARKSHRSEKHSIYNLVESFMILNGVTLFKGMKFNETSVLSFDIETTGISLDNSSTVLLISNTFRDTSGKIQRKLFALDEYKSQGEMIYEWCKWVQLIDPQIMLGHNIYIFDLPYLEHCSNGGLALGKTGKQLDFATKTKNFRREAGQFYEYFEPYVYGRQVVDTLFLMYKHDQASRKYQSYGLKYIIEYEGLERKGRIKWDFSESLPKEIYKDYIYHKTKHTRAEDRDLAFQKWKDFKEYCIDDSDDSLKLWDLAGAAYFYICQHLPLQIQTIVNTATGRWINSFLVRSYLQEGHAIPKADPKEAFGGGISFGNPGIYQNVYKVDVSSLYPSIMITNNVYNKHKDPNANFLKMVTYFTAERLQHKAKSKDSKYHKDMSEAQKIFINSAYGILGTKGLNFNSMKDAGFVTKTGREYIQMGCEWVCGRRLRKEVVRNNDGSAKIYGKGHKREGEIVDAWKIDNSKELGGKHYTLVNVDTDSFSYSTPSKLKLVTEAQVKRSSKGIVELDEFKDHIKEINSLYPDGINWEDDGWFKAAIILKAKNYILQRDKKWAKDNGEKEITMKGSITSRTRENRLREFVNDVIILLLKNKPERLFSVYNSCAKEIQNIEDMTDWVKYKTVTSKVLSASTPENEKVLAAIGNKAVQEGDKIKLFYLNDKEMGLLENFEGEYFEDKYLEKLYKSLKLFENIVDLQLFPNYKNSTNKDLL